MKQETCCGKIMNVMPVDTEDGILFSYECDLCGDGFARDPGEVEVDLIEEYRKESEK